VEETTLVEKRSRRRRTGVAELSLSAAVVGGGFVGGGFWKRSAGRTMSSF
jgi:hypothetical protein